MQHHRAHTQRDLMAHNGLSLLRYGSRRRKQLPQSFGKQALQLKDLRNTRLGTMSLRKHALEVLLLYGRCWVSPPGRLNASPRRGRRSGVLQIQPTASRSPAMRLTPSLLMAPLVGRYAYSPQHAADVCSIANVVLPDAALTRTNNLQCMLDANRRLEAVSSILCAKQNLHSTPLAIMHSIEMYSAHLARQLQHCLLATGSVQTSAFVQKAAWTVNIDGNTVICAEMISNSWYSCFVQLTLAPDR